MSIVFNRKIEILLTKEDSFSLDGQSKICNWLYNQLVQATREDYQNGSPLKLLEGRNLRDYATSMKKEYPFLRAVHSSPLKNTALRLKDAYDRLFHQQTGYPKFRSWKEKWFSLYFDEPNKGFKLVDSKTIQISLGKNEQGEQMRITGSLKEPFSVKQNEEIKTFRMCKQQGNRFYGIFTIERRTEHEKEVKKVEKNIKKMKREFLNTYSIAKRNPKKENKTKKKSNIAYPVFPKGTKWVSLDPNHKNFFVAVDDQGISYEMSTLFQTKYWDQKIDQIKSKRDRCTRKSIQHTTEYGTAYWQPSRRWSRYNRTLNQAYNTRREQIKVSLYSMSHWLFDQYDVVFIGDYTPTNETATSKKMKRSMLNQEHIGQFRNILKWVAVKRGKQCVVVDEKNTTKECAVCGHKEKKEPAIRSFTCVSCGYTIVRDLNSAINIAKKTSILSGSDWVTEWKLDTITYAVRYDLFAANHAKPIVPIRKDGAKKLNPAV
ncbi:RNA-guided endonuclease InsQ/TnpB family protein [Metabacillus rhizolycopersici]|uniref:Transposase n=1 Tax=Metabacillus rhizolycopersici TaxID=2875709 RepID=A0ABS7UXC3_9BACI|nr:RNA-guided endonuclease TnpB family protein [Metabacillus rhizolycopersici]MBZ5752697.1 transposase [Metabacillus rhizolycopersici]